MDSEDRISTKGNVHESENEPAAPKPQNNHRKVKGNQKLKYKPDIYHSSVRKMSHHDEKERNPHVRRSYNKWEDIRECYKLPIGCDVQVPDYKVKEYRPNKYETAYMEYKYIPNTFVNGRESEYFGSVEYALTAKNYLPFRNRSQDTNLDYENERDDTMTEDTDDEEAEQEDDEDEDEEQEGRTTKMTTVTSHGEPDRVGSITPTDVATAVIISDAQDEDVNNNTENKTPTPTPTPSPSISLPADEVQSSPTPSSVHEETLVVAGAMAMEKETETNGEEDKPEEVKSCTPKPQEEVLQPRAEIDSPEVLVPAAAIESVPVVERSNDTEQFGTTQKPKLAPEIIAVMEAYIKIHSLH